MAIVTSELHKSIDKSPVVLTVDETQPVTPIVCGLVIVLAGGFGFSGCHLVGSLAVIDTEATRGASDS